MHFHKRGNTSESRVVASDVIGAVVGPSTDTGPSLDVGVGGDVQLSRADVGQDDKGAGEQGIDLVTCVALSDSEGNKGGRCAEQSRKDFTEGKKMGEWLDNLRAIGSTCCHHMPRQY